MAKLTVWLHQGTVIPSGHQQSGLEGAFTGSDNILKNDGWYEFSGTEAVIKSDKSIGYITSGGFAHYVKKKTTNVKKHWWIAKII